MDPHHFNDADLRVSHSDRAEVAQRLEKAVGDGLITLDEFTERTDQALAARTRGELRAVLADLPGMQLAYPQGAVPPAQTAPEVLRGRMSSIARKGQWTVPARIVLDTRMCSTVLDFTAATLQRPLVEVNIDDYASSTEFILPDDATADLNGVETTAGGATLKVPQGPASQRLHLVVRGRVRFGSITARYAYGSGLRRMWRH